MLNDVALPISSPKGITVPLIAFNTARVDSLRTLPPSSNWIRLKSETSEDVVVSKPINLTPSIVAVGKVV